MMVVMALSVILVVGAVGVVVVGSVVGCSIVVGVCGGVGAGSDHTSFSRVVIGVVAGVGWWGGCWFGPYVLLT